jgi:lipoate-protein ligase A
VPSQVASSGSPPLRVSVDGPLELRESFDRDEGLLSVGGLAARVALLRGRHLSYGVGVPGSAPYLRRAEDAGIPIVRRTTGGTGLLHEDGDLAWSVVLPRSDPRVGRDFVRAYARLGRGALRFLEELGLAGSWGPAPGTAPDYCTLSSRGEVLRVEERIVGGAAQHVVRSSILHQSTISVDLHRPDIGHLFGLPSPGPSDRLAGLRELGVRASSTELLETLARALAASLASG